MRSRWLLSVPVFLIVVAGCSRVAGLPEVPADLTAEEVGIADLERAAREAPALVAPLTDGERSRFSAVPPAAPVDLARWALARIEAGDKEDGLELLGTAVEAAPDSLVLGNAYRMATYRLKRRALADRKRRGEVAPELPDYLERQPLETLEQIAARSPGPQIDLQIALSYVDRMVLNPALEIKAPASIESTHLLSESLAEHPHYVPALYARGLNYLFRPRKLVWPEDPKPPRDAASRDFALAAAAALEVGGAPDRLRALVLVTLGDAHAHQGEMGRARSWWMLARESGADTATLQEIATRMTWNDTEGPDRLEMHLSEIMADADHPVGDLSFLWSEEVGS